MKTSNAVPRLIVMSAPLRSRNTGAAGQNTSRDPSRQNPGAHGVALPGFLGDRIAERNPLVIRRLHTIDREIQFAGAAHAPFFLGLRDGAGHPRAFRDNDALPTRIASVTDSSTIWPSTAVADEMGWSSFTRTFVPSGKTICAEQAHTDNKTMQYVFSFFSPIA